MGRSPEYERRIKGETGQAEKDIAREIFGNGCVACNRLAKQFHHRHYKSLTGPGTIKDKAPACKRCHPIFDLMREFPDADLQELAAIQRKRMEAEEQKTGQKKLIVQALSDWAVDGVELDWADD